MGVWEGDVFLFHQHWFSEQRKKCILKISNANFNKFVVRKPIDVGGFESAIDFGDAIGDVVQNGVS